MLVQRIVLPASALESWTVLGDDAAPVEPIERYLAYLSDIERSLNTVKAYAHDLKDWFSFLGIRGLAGARYGSRMSASSSPGCGCRRSRDPARSRCCLRSIIIAARRP